MREQRISFFSCFLYFVCLSPSGHRQQANRAIQAVNETPRGFGWNIPTTSRIQFVGEATAEVFVGGHTPNTTFGAEDPVDLTGGLRFDVSPRVILRAAYRRPVNQYGGDKNGFVVSASFVDPLGK
jgi:hypothetical protein